MIGIRSILNLKEIKCKETPKSWKNFLGIHHWRIEV